MIFALAGERNDRLIGTMPVCQALIDRIIVLYTPGNTGGYYHCAGLTADFPLGNDLFMEMLHHHGSLFPDGIAIALHKAAKFFLRTLLIKHRIIFNCFHQFVEAVDRGIVLKHIQNKALLNCLLHRIHVEWPVLDFVPILIRYTKGL